MKPPSRYVQNRMAQREITEADIDMAVTHPETQYSPKAHSDRTVILGRTTFGGCLKVVVCTNEPESVITVAEHMDEQSRSTWTSSESTFAEHDLLAGSTYVQLSEAPVARTLLHISDVIMVDVDDYGRPVGVEVVARLDTIEREDWYALAKVVPEVKQIFKEYFPL
jgi:Domain of unknown function (DUF4258)